MRVSIMVTCIVDMFYPGVAEKMVRLLRRHGAAVDFPEAQICCGQPGYTTGFHAQARAVSRPLLGAFARADYVVTPSGSCGGMLKHHLPELFAGDPGAHTQAEALSAKTYEFSQFLVNVLGVTDIGATFKARATYHPSCHATRELGVRDEPRRLLEAVRGLELIDLPAAEDCCGFGGAFAVKMPDVSEAMAENKVANVLTTGADVLVSTDVGCLMNIGGLLSRQGRRVRPMHLIELLAEGVGL